VGTTFYHGDDVYVAVDGGDVPVAPLVPE